MECRQCIRGGILEIIKHSIPSQLKKKPIILNVHFLYTENTPHNTLKIINMIEKFCIHKYWISLIPGSTGSYMLTFLKSDVAHIP